MQECKSQKQKMCKTMWQLLSECESSSWAVGQLQIFVCEDVMLSMCTQWTVSIGQALKWSSN